jgi:Ca-activated chloride channel family protein
MDLPSFAFQLPWLLLLLIPVIALAVGYVFLQVRRRHYAVSFTNLDLLSSVVPKQPGWRRHVPAAAVGGALALLVVGLAQPTQEVPTASESRIVMLAIDTSASMQATDVAPSRLEAAVEAATTFVDDMPADIEVGLVSFSSSAQLDVAPTLDHDEVTSSLSQLQPSGGTASGDAIVGSLRAIQLARSAAGVPSGSAGPSASIVLLADGDQQSGVSLDAAAGLAKREGVPVSTITFGTADGTVTLSSGLVVPVPPDPAAMAAVAQETGGQAFDAASIDELNTVYSQIQGDIGTVDLQSPLWPWFIGIAFLMLLTASAAGLFWSGRFL